MGFSYSLPVVGQPHSTEDPKVGTALTTLSTWGNGQIVDTDLNSPNNSFRRLLLTANAPGTSAAGTYLMGNGGLFATSAAISGIPVWNGDAGYSSQPQDFQVANKSAFCRLRASAITNTIAPACTYTFSLSPITGTAGSGGNLTLTLGAAVGSIAIASPPALNFVGAESAQFAMPVGAVGYVLSVVISSTPTANSATLLNAALYGYNA